MGNLRHRPRAGKLSGWAALMCGLAFCSPAAARITRLAVTALQSPSFAGREFPGRAFPGRALSGAGAYEKLSGTFYGEVDPHDPQDRLITDIALAPRNARGMVEYSGPFILLRPVDAAGANHRLLLDVNNRGNILGLGSLNNAASNTNDPGAAADAGDGYLMRQGYTIAWTAWDAVSGATPGTGGGPFILDVPVARHPDGSDIVGPSLEEFVVDDDKTLVGHLTYPTASRDTRQASLTARAQVSDLPVALPPDAWRYDADGTAISLLPEGTRLTRGRLYELVYPATRPKVAGLGFAALRDIAAFFRRAERDDDGAPNPAAGVTEVYTSCVSQPCRFMRDFVALGFNEVADSSASRSPGPTRVVDGVLNWVGGGSGIDLNRRFAEPFRTHRQHIARWYPEFRFPFAYQTTTDGVTGRRDGLLARCTASATCPKIIDVNSENEYWAKDGALLHTTTDGRDLPDLEGVREYLLAGRQHGDGIPVSGRDICQQPRNPLVANPALRALLAALDRWVSTGAAPPPSMLPRRGDATLVDPAQDAVGFPDIPGVGYNGRVHTGDLLYFGPQETQGIATLWPPTLLGAPYPVGVPKTDADGNVLAGIRLPDVAVPLATYTGWNLRADTPGEGCDASGMVVAFARTKAERLASGDPRLSLEERYPSHDAYARAVAQAAEALRAQGLLLDEDAARYIEAAGQSDVGR